MDQLTRNDPRHRNGDSRVLGRGSGLPCRFGCRLVFRRPDDDASLAALLAAAGDRDAHEIADHGRVYAVAPTPTGRRLRLGSRTGGMR